MLQLADAGGIQLLETAKTSRYHLNGIFQQIADQMLQQVSR